MINREGRFIFQPLIMAYTKYHVNLMTIFNLLIVGFSLNTSFVLAQATVKPPIDFNAINNWPYISSPSINDNAHYAGYMQRKRSDSNATLFIKSLNGKWTKVYDSIKRYDFVLDDRVLILTYKNQLKILQLDRSSEEIINSIIDYQIITNTDKPLLLYKDTSNILTLLDLKNYKKTSYDNIEWYQQSRDSKHLIFITKYHNNKLLHSLSLNNLKEDTVCNSPTFDNLIFDDRAEYFAFTNSTDSNIKSIIFCTKNNKNSKCITANFPDTELIIHTIDHFSQDGKLLFIRLQEKPPEKLSDNVVMVDIWNTQDAILQPQQLNELSPSTYWAMLNINQGEITRLQFKYEEFSMIDDEYAIITKKAARLSARNDFSSARDKSYLFDYRANKKTLLPFRFLSISPSKKNIICADTTSTFIDLICYKINTSKIIPLTAHLLSSEKSIGDYDIDDRRTMRFYGWLDNGNTMLFIDDFDLWMVDLNKPEKLINLTNGFGRDNGIIFRPIIQSNSNYSLKNISILNAFNIETKQNGYYRVSDIGRNPIKISMGDYFDNIDHPAMPVFFPIKAQKANAWITKRMISGKSENYYYTKDFEKFLPISEFCPEECYNWYTSNLVNFTSLNKEKIQGIFYKPENFDSTKKYPVIINYYEQISRQLHVYHEPDYSMDNINIPYFVSHGYLVFTPDILPLQGRVGECAYNSVVGAAHYLSNLKYIDSTKIGIQGHSFGGSETNFIITKCNKFAAAMTTAGVIDLISMYGSISREGYPFGREYAEFAQGRIGYSLWESPELYIENSPIFQVDKITTPLLMMYNKEDNMVNFTQGIEFFTALRRLNKKAWMLQYDGEGHSLIEERNRIDYTIRLKQFFDHYLKREPMPEWMLYGIPAKLKGYNKGY
jgi:dienelactone hydrolase